MFVIGVPMFVVGMVAGFYLIIGIVFNIFEVQKEAMELKKAIKTQKKE